MARRRLSQAGGAARAAGQVVSITQGTGYRGNAAVPDRRNIARNALASVRRGSTAQPQPRQGGGDGRGPAPAASSSPRGGGRPSTSSPAQRAVVARLTTTASSTFQAPRSEPKPRRGGRVTTENFNFFDNNPDRKPTVLRRAIAAREKTGLATTSFKKGERERFIKNYRATHKNKLSDAQITLIGRYLKSKGKGKNLFAQNIDMGSGSGPGGY